MTSCHQVKLEFAEPIRDILTYFELQEPEKNNDLQRDYAAQKITEEIPLEVFLRFSPVSRRWPHREKSARAEEHYLLKSSKSMPPVGELNWGLNRSRPGEFQNAAKTAILQRNSPEP